MRVFYLALLLCTSNLFAQTLSDTLALEPAIILNNRLQTRVDKENRNIQILTKKELQSLPISSIQDILEYVSGIDLRQRGPMGSQADVSMDGGSFEQTLILLNGVKIIDHQTAHNVLNLPVPVEAIERVEIVRGPGARIYGANSLTGVINFVTKKPTKSSIFTHTYFGSNFKKDEDDSGETFINLGLQIGGNWTKETHQHQLYTSHEKGNGYRYNTAFENNKIYYQTDFQIGDKSFWTANYGYVKNAFGANGFYAAPGDKDSKEVVETTLASLQTRYQISDNWTLNPRVSYRYNFDDYRYFKYDLDRARSRHFTHSLGTEINSTVKFKNHVLGLGFEFRDESINSTNIQKHHRNNFGFYGEFKSDWTDKFNLNLGAYVNYNSQFGWQIFPGLDASYKINSDLKIVANVGTSQRIPSFTDLYLDQRPGNVGNPNLKDEKSFQTELGLKFNRRNWRFETYYFYRNIDDFIDWIKDIEEDPWQASNSGNLRTQGLNAKLEYKFTFIESNIVRTSLQYAFLDNQLKNDVSQSNSKYKIESLRHQIIHAFHLNFSNVQITLLNRYNVRESYKDYWITDVRLSYKFMPQFTIYWDGQNIFATHYVESGAIPLPSQWFVLGLKCWI